MQHGVTMRSRKLLHLACIKSTLGQQPHVSDGAKSQTEGEHAGIFLYPASFLPLWEAASHFVSRRQWCESFGSQNGWVGHPDVLKAKQCESLMGLSIDRCYMWHINKLNIYWLGASDKNMPLSLELASIWLSRVGVQSPLKWPRSWKPIDVEYFIARCRLVFGGDVPRDAVLRFLER